MRPSHSPDLLTLGALVRERRRALDLTQEQLAGRLGWSQERVSILENGKYGMPSLPLLAHLAAALDLPLSAIMDAVGFNVSESVSTDLHTGEAGDGLRVNLSSTLQRLLAIQSPTLEGAMNEASDLLVAAMGADKVDIFLYEPESDSLVALGTSNTEMGRRQHREGLAREPLAAGGRQVHVFRTGEKFYTGHADLDMGISRDLVNTLGVRSLYAVPLLVHDKISGILVAESAHPDRFSQAQQDFLEAASRWVGIVAERAELREQIERRGAKDGR